MASAAEQLARNLNFSTFSKAKVLQQRILFTLGALLVYRFGTYIPVPGIDPQAYAQTFQQGAAQGIFGMFDLFAGGAVHRMAVFALNLIPYITASIVVQVISTASPRLEALKKEGEAGRRKINQYTRYLAVVFCAIQAYGIAIGLEGSQGVVLNPGWFFRISTIVTLVGGTMFLVWLGDQITSRGIGNGTSLIIMSGIVANLPTTVVQTLELLRQAQSPASGPSACRCSPSSSSP
jgi:preprotein translocase subunit SecY